MDYIKNKGLGIVCTFLFAIILCGAASASSTHFSSDGKNITVTDNYISSTLKTSITTQTGTGSYGYGKYVRITISGKDNKGRNSLRIMNAYNGVAKSMVYKVSSTNFAINELITYGATKATLKVSGRMNSTVTFSGTGSCPVYYLNGQKVLNNGLITIYYYRNGKVFAKTTDKSVTTYKSFNGQYRFIKTTHTMNSFYSNGNTRKSVINNYYLRNSIGTLTGMKLTGISQGTEKINTKTVTYTGKIYATIKHDPKDLYNEGYNLGDYKEVRTSSSATLLKIVPFETI
jgi:hypothetical protein